MLFKSTLSLSVIAATFRIHAVQALSTTGRMSKYPKISTMTTTTTGQKVDVFCETSRKSLLAGAHSALEGYYSSDKSLVFPTTCGYFPHCSSPKEPQLELHHNPEEVIQHTKAWVDGMIVGLRLCPFARSADLAGAPPGPLRYEVSTATTITEMHADWFESVSRFVDTDEEEVAALQLLFPQLTSDMPRFYTFACLQIGCLKEIPFIQCLAFHPQFFTPDKTPKSSPDWKPLEEAVSSYYARRSPYPMLQFIRSEMTARVKKGDLHAFAHVKVDNNKKLAEVGEDKLQAIHAGGQGLDGHAAEEVVAEVVPVCRLQTPTDLQTPTRATIISTNQSKGCCFTEIAMAF